MKITVLLHILTVFLCRASITWLKQKYRCAVKCWMGMMWCSLASAGLDRATHPPQKDLYIPVKGNIPRVRGDTCENNPPPIISKHAERMHSFSFSFTVQRCIQNGGQAALRGTGTDSTIIKKEEEDKCSLNFLVTVGKQLESTRRGTDITKQMAWIKRNSLVDERIMVSGIKNNYG